MSAHLKKSPPPKKKKKKKKKKKNRKKVLIPIARQGINMALFVLDAVLDAV